MRDEPNPVFPLHLLKYVHENKINLVRHFIYFTASRISQTFDSV